MGQLSDTNYYKKFGEDPTPLFALELENIIKSFPYQLQEKLPPLIPHFIPRIFYMLPKIHRKSNPDRAIIFKCGTPTEELSRFTETILK